MKSRTSMTAIHTYLQAIADTKSTGYATEHSYRPYLQAFIETVGGESVKALNEPSRIECGAPDFIVERNGVPLGHIECKDVGVNLEQVAESAQLMRYREGLPNLILTDYLDFHWYVEGSLRESARLGRLNNQGSVVHDQVDASQVAGILEAYFGARAPSVGNSRDLANRMAAKARLLYDGILEILGKENTSGPLHDLLKAYREVLITDLTYRDFADLQAQTAAYGLFAARCRHQPNSGAFTRQSAVFAEMTPFLKESLRPYCRPGHRPSACVDHR